MKPLQTLIREHVKRYPEMQIMDVFRLIHQGTFGVGHRIANPQSEREWLEHQWQISKPEPGTLIETVSMEGEPWVRLNLRPYIAGSGTQDALLQAMVLAAAVRTGTGNDLSARWNVFAEMVAEDRRLQERFPAWEVRLYGVARAKDEWAIVPHSPEYLRKIGRASCRER